jgi:hypothetical protein
MAWFREDDGLWAVSPMTVSVVDFGVIFLLEMRSVEGILVEEDSNGFAWMGFSSVVLPSE